jgi:hypothetical protein
MALEVGVYHCDAFQLVAAVGGTLHTRKCHFVFLVLTSRFGLLEGKWHSALVYPSATR